MSSGEPDDAEVSKWAALLGPDTDEPGGVWLRTDEIDEFIGALEHTVWLAESVGDDVNRWKWLIIALHNTVQGACVCALRGRDTAGISMLTEKSAERAWQWLNVDSRKEPPPPMPKERLAPMEDLFERVKTSDLLDEDERVPPDEDRDNDVKKLNELRNTFSHFVPRGLSLEVSGMPRIVRHCCDIIEHLAVKRSTFWHHLYGPRPIRINAALVKLRESMAAWERLHDATTHHEPGRGP